MGKLDIILKNDLAELTRLAELTEQFGEEHAWPARVIYGVNLSLDELVTNVISYGYEDAQAHQILIHFSFENGVLTLLMEDDGRAFNPLDIPEPDVSKPLEERATGGLGIFLVRKTMDQVEYRRNGGRNILKMTKKIDQTPHQKPTSHGNP